MKIVDATWSIPVNIVTVVCDCGNRFFHPTRISTIRCPKCDKRELWHGADPAEGTIWDMPVAKVELER